MHEHTNSRRSRASLLSIVGLLLLAVRIPSSSSFRLVSLHHYQRQPCSTRRIVATEEFRYKNIMLTPEVLYASSKKPIKNGIYATKRCNTRIVRLLSSLRDDEGDDDDDELGLEMAEEGDWTEEEQLEDSRTAESRAALRNLLGRFWARKKDNVQLIPPPDNMGDSSSNANNQRKQLPQWLRDQQEERNRIRQLGKDEKRLHPFEVDQQRLVSTTGNVQNLMKGMPSLDDMFGENTKNDNTMKVPEWQQGPSHFDTSDVNFSNKDDLSSSLPRLSTSGEISRTQLGERMKSLLQEAAIVSSSSSLEHYNYSAAVETKAMEALEGFKEGESSVPNNIADQRYRSLRKVDDDTIRNKRSQFDNFLQQEQQLRQKMGLTGSLFEKEQRDKVKWNVEQEQMKTTQEEVSKSPAAEGRDDSASIKSEGQREEVSGESADALKTTFVFDEYGTDPSFAEWKPKTSRTSIEDARYRSFSAAKATKESKDAFELFLNKEKEMREKLGMKKPNETTAETTNADGRTSFNSSLWSEVEELYAVEHSNDEAADDYYEEELSSISYEEDDIEKFKPKPMSIADLRFRSLAKQSTSNDDDKKTQFKEFLKKEQQMRQKLGYDSINVDEADVIVEEEPHPHSQFYDEDEVEKNLLRQQQRSQAPDLQVVEEREPPQTGGAVQSSMWSALEDLYTAKYSAEDQDEEVMKQFENIATDLFVRGNRRSMRAPRLIERSTFSSFETRKKDLLENTELTVEELDLLFEFDPLLRLSTINKPDSAFGAIFRFEGKYCIGSVAFFLCQMHILAFLFV